MSEKDKGWKDAPENSIIGHVHLRVVDPADAEQWWHSELGFDTVANYGKAAVFFSTGGYHRHIGANSWQSAGAGTRDKDRTGLAWVEMHAKGAQAEKMLQDPWGPR